MLYIKKIMIFVVSWQVKSHFDSRVKVTLESWLTKGGIKLSM